MEPRLPKSRKWTPLPKEFLQQIRTVFADSFKQQIGKGKMVADGRIYPEEILISVGYIEPGSIRQRGFDVSVEYKKDKDNVLKLLHLAVDAAGSLFEQLFTADESEFPLIWTQFDFEGRKIFAQYSTTNEELEAAADKFLGKASGEDDLTQGDWEDEIDPDIIKAQLGIDGDDEDLLGDDDEPDDEKPAKPGKSNRKH